MKHSEGQSKRTGSHGSPGVGALAARLLVVGLRVPLLAPTKCATCLRYWPFEARNIDMCITKHWCGL